MASETDGSTERKIMAPSKWLLYSTALFAIILVPLFTGAFYIIKVSWVLFQERVEYSVVAGMIVGLLASLAAGWFYSNVAKKHVE
jgi:hypothetical protein